MDKFNFMDMLAERVKDDPQLKNLNSFLGYYVYKSDEEIMIELKGMIKVLNRNELKVYIRDINLLRNMRNEYVTEDVKMRAKSLQSEMQRVSRYYRRRRRRRSFREYDEYNNDLNTDLFTKLGFFYIFRNKAYYLPNF